MRNFLFRVGLVCGASGLPGLLRLSVSGHRVAVSVPE